MYTRATSLPKLYIRNIIPHVRATFFWGTGLYRGGAMLLLSVSLAALFHELVAPEVADEH